MWEESPRTVIGVTAQAWAYVTVVTVVFFVSHVSFSLLGVALMILVLRQCWIEENIHDDLRSGEALPPGYRQRVERRQMWCAFWGLPIPPDVRSSREMALRLRHLSAWLWSVFWSALLSVLLSFQEFLWTFWGFVALSVCLWGVCGSLNLVGTRAEKIVLSWPVSDRELFGRPRFVRWFFNGSDSL